MLMIAGKGSTRRTNYLIPLLVIFFFGSYTSLSKAQNDAASEEAVKVTGLKTEYLTNPKGLDLSIPRFSWHLHGPKSRGIYQTAYRVIVSSNKKQVEDGEGNVWDSGKITSEKTINIHYDGHPLERNKQYYWRVQVWSETHNNGIWSPVNQFHIGLLNEEDWQADWITHKDSTIQAPVFREEFNVGQQVYSAYAYVTGIGYYEFYLNGEKIGNNVLDPGMTDFGKRILYETYDVKDQLTGGANAVGLMLGNGGYRLTKKEGRYLWDSNHPFSGPPRGIVQLHITFTDGTQKVIKTQESWRSSASPITFNSIYSGEDYDARLEQPGWNKADFDDSGWSQSVMVDDSKSKLDAQLMPPIRVTQTLDPIHEINPEEGVYLYDLGQNIPGWWRVHVRGQKDTELTIRGAETLNNNLFPTNLKEGDQLSDKHDYHKNVWTTYTLKGEGVEEYEPRFFYKGYRYIEVKVDNPDALESLRVEGRVVHSDLERNGVFASSDTLLNQIYEASVWSQRGNLHGYPTDCPHREKGGYTGDGQVIAETSMHDFHMHSFYEKWLNDMKDAQEPGGRIPNTAPPIIGGHGGGIAWGSAYILIPWWMHQYYNDDRILETHYSSMKKYLDYLYHLARNDENKQERYIINEFGGFWDSLGEWVAPGERTDKNNPLVNTFYWYLNNKTMADISEAIGKREDHEHYVAMADTIKQAFNKKFFDPESNLYGSDSAYQTYLVFTLDQNMIPEGHREKVMENLINDIMVEHNGHLNTGILGTKYLFRVLAEANREDVIHEMVTQKTYPSWGYWIENGATTLWERWDATSSHNHQMFGTVNEYLYKYLAGIRAPTDQGTTTGYNFIHIKPYIPETLSWAEASVETVRGEVQSRWEKNDKNLLLSVVIPANTKAKVSIPNFGSENISITEGNQLVWDQGAFRPEVEGLTNATADKGYILVEVESGSYQFHISRN